MLFSEGTAADEVCDPTLNSGTTLRIADSTVLPEALSDRVHEVESQCSERMVARYWQASETGHFKLRGDDEPLADRADQ
jgi:hypothetical protein